MNSDACFHIGKAHTVCQDYARAGYEPSTFGVFGGGHHAILSDGCSSAPDTDFGSRFMVMAAISNLSGGQARNLDPRKVIQRASEFRHDYLCIPSGCLDATLLTLMNGEGDDSTATVTGDGALAAIRRDGRLEVWDITFKPGEITPGNEGVCPCYLSYMLDEERLARYIKLGHGQRVVTRTLGDTVEVTEDRVTMDGKGWSFDVDFKFEEYRAIFAFSDGVHSFQKSVGAGLVDVPYQDVIKQLTAIKNYTGSFVERRTKAFLDRYCRDNQWSHYDDLSVVAIDFGERANESLD